MLTLGIEDIKDLIQMVDLLIKRNSFEMGDLKELRIFFKDERILKIKTNRIIVDKETLECFDNERNLWFTFNFNEIIYYTIEKKVKKMYEVTYSMEGIIRKIMINASDAVQAQSIFTNMYGSGKVQIINIRRV